jgi:signal recognition particle receptor subunit beta
MAVYEQDLDRIVIRVVYDGPGRAGKTANIEQLARLFGGDSPDLQLLAADNGHTVFFDWLTFDGGMIDGHHLLIQIVGVPGAKRFEHRRAHILRSADAVVLVCDSAPGTTDLARETLDSLREHLGRRAASTPIIVQANKQDLPGALQAHEVGAALGLPYEIPVIGAEATAGIGTRETAVHAIRSAVRLVKRRTAKPGLSTILGMAGTAQGLRAALEATSIGDSGPDDDPADLVPIPEPTPGRRVARPTIVEEPHLVYMHNQSGPVQAAKIRVGEPGDAEPVRIDPAETLPSTPIIIDEPEPEPEPEPLPRSRRGRRRDTETTEVRVQRNRKERPSQVSEPRTPTAARATNGPAAPRKLPPRRRAGDDVPTPQGRPPSGSVRIVDDTPAARSRPPSGRIVDDIPTPRDRPPSGSVRVIDDVPTPRDRPPSGSVRVVDDVPTSRDRPPSGSVRIVDDVPTSRDRPPSGSVRIVDDVPTSRDRPPSGSVRVVDDVPTPRGRPASGSVRVENVPTPQGRPASGSVRVENVPAPGERTPSGTVRAADGRPSSAPVPRFRPPSSPTTPSTPQTLGPLPVRAQTATDEPTGAPLQPSTSDVSPTAATLPPSDVSSRPSAPDPSSRPSAPDPTSRPSAPDGAAATLPPTDVATARTLLPQPARPDDDMSPRTVNLSPRPDVPPTPDVPPGHVWPVPGGRGVLKALAAAAAPRFPQGADGERTRYTSGPFHLTAQRYPDQDQALAALLARARLWQPVTPLLAKGLALAVDAEPDGTHHLYRVAFQLPALIDHLAGLTTTARLRLLESHALALGQAFTLCRRKRIVLDLDPAAYAVEYGRVVYVRDHLAHADNFNHDVGPALLALPEQLADDPTIDSYIDALARELTALVDGETSDLGLAAALTACEPISYVAKDARTRLLAALGQF